MDISNELNRYWRLHDYSSLDKESLSTRVMALGTDQANLPGTRSQLVEILERHERGQICYDRYSDQQLEDLSRSIGWAVRPLADGLLWYWTHLRLIEALQEADDDGRVFGKILSLPAELRLQIYEHHFATYPETLVTPAQPPITRTCRLIRREALPLFYK